MSGYGATRRLDLASGDSTARGRLQSKFAE
jgi:hypothetical protein